MRQELEHIRCGHLQRILPRHRDEGLDKGHRPQRVGPAPARHELQIPTRIPRLPATRIRDRWLWLAHTLPPFGVLTPSAGWLSKARPNGSFCATAIG
jgi:hypothetical protein